MHCLCFITNFYFYILESLLMRFVFNLVEQLSIWPNNKQKLMYIFIFKILQLVYYLKMSISEILQSLKTSSKVILNDKYMGDKGARQLSKFLQNHKKVQYLQIKNNDITAVGFVDIFKALVKNPQLRQINIEHNSLGEDRNDSWSLYLQQLLNRNTNIQRLNFSNNKINGPSFNLAINSICRAPNLKLLQLRYNQIPSANIKEFIKELEQSKNQSLLYVELTGNKIQKQIINSLQTLLKTNRQLNPIPKDNLMMTGGFSSGNNQRERQIQQQSQSKTKTNALDFLSKQNILRHLQGILHDNRKTTNQMKIKLQNQMSDLEKRDKLDVEQISQLDKKCNQLIIANRNLNIEIERTNLQHKKIQKDQQFEAKVKQQRIQQANRQLTQMNSKFEEIQNKLNREHDAKMKQITRKWEARLRNIEQKIRQTQLDTNTVQNQITKAAQKRQRLRAEYEQQERTLRQRINEQQSQRYRFKIQALQARLKQVQSSRQKFYMRSQGVIYQLQKRETQNNKQIQDFSWNYQVLKSQQEQLIKKNKNFVTRNESIKHDIQLKQIQIQKYEEEINKINEQIQLRKKHNQQQIEKIIVNHENNRNKKSTEKQTDIQKLNQMETTLRNYQLQNAKLSQQYQILQQKLQVSLSKSVQQVFTETNLY